MFSRFRNPLLIAISNIVNILTSILSIKILSTNISTDQFTVIIFSNTIQSLQSFAFTGPYILASNRFANQYRPNLHQYLEIIELKVFRQSFLFLGISIGIAVLSRIFLPAYDLSSILYLSIFLGSILGLPYALNTLQVNLLSSISEHYKSLNVTLPYCFALVLLIFFAG